MGTSLQRLGKYTLLERLGGIGRVEVWKAFSPQSGRTLAIKLFHEHQEHEPGFICRFEREVKPLIFLHHQHIVQIYEAQVSRPPETEHTVAYMVMDYIAGQTLADYIQTPAYNRKIPSAADIVHLFASICSAVDYAHQKGAIHGAIKPANILLDKRVGETIFPADSHMLMGEPRLAGFGIASLLETSPGNTAAALHWGLDMPSYLSPEQAQGYPANERSDVYALGVILYEICTGMLPFKGDSASEVMLQHINAKPTPPVLLNPRIPPALSAVILHSLEKNPKMRFRDAFSMAITLTEVLNRPMPDILSRSNRGVSFKGPPVTATINTAKVIKTSSRPYPVHAHAASQVESWPPNGDTQPRHAVQLASAARGNPAFSLQHAPLASPKQPPVTPTTPPAIPVPPPPSQKQLVKGQWQRTRDVQGDYVVRKRKVPFINQLFFALVILFTGALVLSSLGVLFTLAHRNQSSALPVVGHVFFVSSWQGNARYPEGNNDEVQIDLHNIPAPGAGKSYYAWLLGDVNQPEMPWVSLGKVAAKQGNISFLYRGDDKHTNLLSGASRFLLTEEDAKQSAHNPFLAVSTWRYYAALPQQRSSVDADHFSMLDHLRHLLVQAPELHALGISGGLSTWMLRNTAEILRWSVTAKNYWKLKDLDIIRYLLMDILYYLDGECASADVQDVPPGAPTMPADTTIAHNAHFALLDPCMQGQADDPKNALHHTPHDYLDHVLFHVAGVLQSPGATQTTGTMATQINAGVNHMKSWLGQLHKDALHLVNMNDLQLADAGTFKIFSDMELQARYAFAGKVDPQTGEKQAGADWLYTTIQRLASFDVTPYSK